MKKILFTLAFIVAIISTAVSLSGCTGSGESDPEYIQCSGQFKYEFSVTNVTTEQVNEAKGYQTQLNERGVKLLGSSYTLEVNQNTSTITDDAKSAVFNAIAGDSEIQALIDKLFSMKDSDGNLLIKRVYYTILSGSASQGVWTKENTK